MKAIYQGGFLTQATRRILPIFIQTFLIFIKRVGYQYFLLEINPGSLELCGGAFCVV